MDNETFVRQFGRLYFNAMAHRKDEDYVPNPPQIEKLIAVHQFFLDMAKECNGRVELEQISPRQQHGGLNAYYIVFHICGEQIKRFQTIMSYCSAVSIDTTIDGHACISCTVPNLFVHK